MSTTFTITNNTGEAETISSVMIALSNPKLFSDIGLSANGQEGAGPQTPSNSNTFAFSPAIALATGASVEFTFSGTIAGKSMASAMPLLGQGIAYAAVERGEGPAPESRTIPWLAMVLLGGFVMIGWRRGSRSWLLAGGALLLIFIIAGCGGSSGGAPAPSSSVTVVGVTTSGAGGATLGLPLKIATVTKG